MSSWTIRNQTRKSVGVNYNRTDGHLTMDLFFQLSKKGLDHIDFIRSENADRDVKVQLELNIGIIESKSSNAHIYAHKEADSQNVSSLFRHTGTDQPYDGRDIGIISTTHGIIFDVVYHEFNKHLTITSSEWAQKFCPALGVGKYASVDLFIPELEQSDTVLDQYLNDAIQTVQNMERFIHSGEWSSVVEESRKLTEVIRKKDNKSYEQWRELLSNSGYHDDTLDTFYDMLQNLFQFASKFVHRINYKKDLRDQVKVEKEDAYFIYSTSIGLINLLSRKLQESKKSQ